MLCIEEVNMASHFRLLLTHYYHIGTELLLAILHLTEHSVCILSISLLYASSSRMLERREQKGDVPLPVLMMGMEAVDE